MPVTRAPTACRARTNSRWLAGKQGSRNTMSMGMAISHYGRSARSGMPVRVKVLFVSSEVTPFAKSGGLGDVSGALPRQLHALGHDVRVVMPMYPRCRVPGREFTLVAGNVAVQLGSLTARFSLYSTPMPRVPGGRALPVYFV